ncbi:MAG: 50S ribosomal protein L29 [Planctomycetota bacterium]
MSDAEIATELEKLREEYFLRRFTSDPKRIQNPGRFQQMRKAIARMLTIQRQRQQGKAPAKA